MNLKRTAHRNTHRWVQPALVAAALVAACFTGGDGNHAPVIEAPTEMQVLSNEKTTLTIQASDPDGDAVRLDAQGLPPFAQFHDNGDGSATIVVDPVEAHHGTYLVTFSATDDASTPAVSTQQVSVRVRSKALVQTCAGSDANIRAQARPLSACRAANGDVELGPGTPCERAYADRDFTGADALGKVSIKTGGALYLLDESREIEVASITVAGLLQAGTSNCPVGSANPDARLTLRFTGDGPTTPPPPPAKHEMCPAVDKGISVESGGQLLLYGARGVADGANGVSWTHLAKPAGPAAYQTADADIAAPVSIGAERQLVLARDVSKGSNPWKAGDWITVATSSFSPFETEFLQIKTVSPAGIGSVLSLQQPLRHYHFGSDDPGPPGAANFDADAKTNYGVDERSEVGLISRNILLTSRTPDPTTSPQDTRLHWGGELRFCAGVAAASVRGVEFEKFGKEQLGSYPIHFHMAGDLANKPIISSNSIHHSYNKCVTMHATSNLTVRDNVCARAVGHLFYQELGSEAGIAFIGNLGLGAMSHHFGIADTVAKTDDGQPENFWEGDHLARANGYSAFNVKNTDGQDNPTHGSCFVPSPNVAGRLELARPSDGGKPPCGPTEYYAEPASGFWIVNPGTRIEGNSIGGCQGIGKGYWYVPPQDGSANALKFNASGVFRNNRVHACYDGLFSEGQLGVASEQLFPKKDGVNDSLNVIGRFSGLTATRNRNRGVWMRPMWTVLDDGRFATNRDSVTLVTSGGNDGNGPGVWALLTNSVVVGISANNVDRWGPCPSRSEGEGPGCVDANPRANELVEKGYQTPRWNSAGYMIYDGPVRIIHNRFVNFLRDPSPLLTLDDRTHLAAYCCYPQGTVYEGDAALGWFQNNQSAYPTATTVKALVFDNVDLRHQIYTSKVNLGDFRDGDMNTALIDLDGSLTGYKVVDAAGNPVSGAHPISLNNLPFNSASNAVDECLATGQQDDQQEGRATSLISPASMATLEFEALWPSPGGNWQDLTFSKDSLDYGRHQSMTLTSRNGQGIWEPKVASGFGYSVLGIAKSTKEPSAGSPGIPRTVRVGFTDAVKPNMGADPFQVRLGLCYTDANGAAPQGGFTIKRGYKSWGGNGVNYNDPQVQAFYNQLAFRYDGEFCHNLDHQNQALNFGAKGCPAHGVIPLPTGGVCPAPSTKSPTLPLCIYPVTTLTAAASLSELTRADGTPASYDKYWYDRDIGMLFFYVMQDAENARGAAPIGSCPGDPACPDASELDTYYACPPQGCINYSVELGGAYAPGAPTCNAKAGGSVYAYQNGRYALPVPANQNRLAFAVKAGALGPGANVVDGEIVQRTEIADNGKGFAHSVATKLPQCRVSTR